MPVAVHQILSWVLSMEHKRVSVADCKHWCYQIVCSQSVFYLQTGTPTMPATSYLGTHISYMDPDSRPRQYKKASKPAASSFFQWELHNLCNLANGTTKTGSQHSRLHPLSILVPAKSILLFVNVCVLHLINAVPSSLVRLLGNGIIFILTMKKKGGRKWCLFYLSSLPPHYSLWYLCV